MLQEEMVNPFRHYIADELFKGSVNVRTALLVAFGIKV